jgi:hypothetical protein
MHVDECLAEVGNLYNITARAFLLASDLVPINWRIHVSSSPIRINGARTPQKYATSDGIINDLFDRDMSLYMSLRDRVFIILLLCLFKLTNTH